MSEKTPFSVTIRSDAFQKAINNALGSPEATKKFCADIISVVSQNPLLKECDAKTIISAGLTAQALKLPLSPTLGFCYLVPYKSKYGYVAQFQVGWKGFVQLGIRTNEYLKIGVRPVHKGEALGLDEFGDEIVKFDHKYDLEETVGYFAYIELIGGFKKTFYWTVEQCKAHARRYSKSYGNGSATDNWTNMFDAMAQKTVLKQLMSKYGIMSIDIQRAIETDQAVIEDDGSLQYVDTETVEEEPKGKTTVNNTIECDDDGVVANGNN